MADGAALEQAAAHGAAHVLLAGGVQSHELRSEVVPFAAAEEAVALETDLRIALILQRLARVGLVGAAGEQEGEDEQESFHGGFLSTGKRVVYSARPTGFP